MSNENSRIDYESGVTPTAMSAVIDSGDHKNFTTSATLFSETSGNAPVIRPNGVLTGGVTSAAISAGDDVVDVTSQSLNLNGVITSVSAALDVSITRAASDVASISSVTVDSSGTVVAVQGVDSADSTFSETRGAPGGPPFIPTDSVELAQTRVTTDVAGPIVAGEIFAVDGTHRELAAFPSPTADNFNAEINFSSALPESHTGSVAKAVYASYSDPIFVEQEFANDFVPSENSHTVSSEQVYGATIGTNASSLGQGSFTAILTDGITDAIIGKKNQTLFFRYFQDESKAPHILTQGKLGLGRTFAASDNPKVACTISSTIESSERAS